MSIAVQASFAKKVHAPKKTEHLPLHVVPKSRFVLVVNDVVLGNKSRIVSGTAKKGAVLGKHLKRAAPDVFARMDIAR